MRRSHLLTLAFATAIAAPSQAALTLFASGTITGSSAGTGLDLSGLTGTLENGNPAAMLGGLGSGLTYAGGNTFLAVPDRGPNAAVHVLMARSYRATASSTSPISEWRPA